MSSDTGSRRGAMMQGAEATPPRLRDLRLIGTRRTGILAAIAAVALSFGITLNGLNNAFGNPLVFMLCGGLLALILLTEPPPARFWKQVAPVILLVALAYGWATSPLWAPAIMSIFDPHYAAPDLVIPELLGAAGLLSAFLAGSLLAARRGSLALVCDWLLAFACANVLLGLLVREFAIDLPWGMWHPRPGTRFTGTLSNANVSGAYFGMMALLALGRITTAPGSDENELNAGKMAARWVALLLCAGACTITASRSAFVSMTAGLIGMAVLEIVRRRRGDRRAQLTAVALLLGIGAVFAAGLAELLLGRFGLVAEQSAARTDMWGNYWELAKQSPWLGYGLGGFPGVSMRAVADPRLAQLLWTVNSPHNLVLQFMLEGGLVFLLLLAAAGVLIAWRIGRNFWRYGPMHGRTGIALAIMVVLSCAMVDIALDVPAMAALTLFLGGLLWGRSQYGERSASLPRTSRHRTMNGT